ncbi:MAG: hypothetical protein M3R68_03635 [Acidobacteriota bacterium]|nr:hypothetical protein [Acidobacteriota bacterium]
MLRFFGAILTVVLLLPVLLCAQTSQSQPPVSNVIAVLTKAVDVKTTAVGDEVALRTISDVVVNGELVIPRGSKLLGKVSEAAAKSKDAPQNVLAFFIEKAVRKDGVQIQLQAIVAAIAAPQKGSLADDPTYGMMHSNEPTMVGSGTRTTTSSGTLSAGSNASSNAAVATANIKGTMDEPSELKEDSQGAIGYEGIAITWRLMSPPPVTVIATKSKGLRLETGTQMLLRMAPPRLPR